MATTKQVMCSMVLVLLVVVASNWKAAECLIPPRECLTPPNNEMPCSASSALRHACNKECIEENYRHGDCYVMKFKKFIFMCLKPGC
ncbi:unnamed protein product [Urochloa decumbens]|uniref:Uncharacterized protein n=1 Tax=Urochloa decumbens TaxID=240449 RepID=A0ABC8VVM8_9POAL